MTINGGGTFTNNTAVNLTLSGTDSSPGSGVAEMRISNTQSGLDSASWEPFATSKQWAVSEGDGEKTVYVQFKDAAGNQSNTAQDTIVLDQTAPAVSSTSPPKNATGVAATANISATFLEAGSGIAPASITDSTFQVVQLKPTGNVEVSGTLLSYDDSSKTATFDPSSTLAKGAYRVTITGVKDLAGNVMPEYTWVFTTAGPSKR